RCIRRPRSYDRDLSLLANSDSPEPTEPVEGRREVRWSLQRKDPAWVVGEHRQLSFWLDCLVRTGRRSPWQGELMASVPDLASSTSDLSIPSFLPGFNSSVVI
ncbi:hypothetical protein GW17_00004231, partial [Ensete ventricosum]